ncbi:unnamed protein product [Heterosigma akashiwo]
MNPVSIRTRGDLFYLRLLLLHVQEPTSFDDLLTFNSSINSTFQDACIARGIMQSDNIWDDTMKEASQAATPSSLRNLFAIMCCHNQLSNPKHLFDTCCEQMRAEDFEHEGYPSEQARNLALLEIEKDVLDMDFTMEKIGLYVPVHLDPVEVQIDRQWHLSRQSMAQTFHGQYDMNNLKPKQLSIAKQVLALAEQVQNGDRTTAKIIYVKGGGGTGKTVLMNTVIWEASQRTTSTNPPLNVAACAFSGIASTLLIGGTTLHKRFHLPLEEGRVPSVSPNSKQGQFLRSVHLFVFDEGSMIPLWVWKAIDNLLRDIHKSDPDEELPPMGGTAVMLSGDFAQILPILEHASRAQVVANCLTQWSEWADLVTPNMQVLTENLRAYPGAIEFVNFLEDLGSGKLSGQVDPNNPDLVALPAECCVSKGKVVEFVFDGLTAENVEQYSDCCILTPWNQVAEEINRQVLERLDVEAKTFFSNDHAELSGTDEENSDPDLLYPSEILNAELPSGFPPHELTLKIGAIVILLRTLSLGKKMCNGRRMKVIRMTEHAILLKHIGELSFMPPVWVPRIIFISKPMPFTFRRTQFPVKLAFCLSIDKSQGSTFRKVGIVLPRPVFSHGHLYVGYSRTKSFDCIRVEILHNAEGLPFQDEEEKEGSEDDQPAAVVTRNIVYKEVFQNLEEPH